MSSFEPQSHDDSFDSMLTEFFESEMPEEIRNRSFPPNLRPGIVSKDLQRESSRSFARSSIRRFRMWTSIGLTAAAVVAVTAAVLLQSPARKVAIGESPIEPVAATTVEPSGLQSAALSSRLEEQAAIARRGESTKLPQTPRIPGGEKVVAGVGGTGVAELLMPLLPLSSPPEIDRNQYRYRVSEAYEPVVSRPDAPISYERRARVRTTNVSFFEPNSGAQIEMQLPELEIEILAAARPGQ